jgi:hypothetical protein
MRPGEETYSPPGPELLGVVTSHGPSRESYTPSRKSSDWLAAASDIPVTDAPVSTQRLRAAFSSPASTPAVLQRGVPGSSAKMVAVEGPATLPADGSGPTEAEWSKPTLPGAHQKAETTRTRSS